MRDQTPVQPACVTRDLDTTEGVLSVEAEVRAFFDYVKQEQV